MIRSLDFPKKLCHRIAHQTGPTLRTLRPGRTGPKERLEIFLRCEVGQNGENLEVLPGFYQMFYHFLPGFTRLCQVFVQVLVVKHHLTCWAKTMLSWRFDGAFVA